MNIFQFLRTYARPANLFICLLIYGLLKKRAQIQQRKFALKISERKFHVVIIGAGMSGLCMAIKLKQKNIPFTIFEKAKQVGGTWNYNSYPGCSCDVPTCLYSFSFNYGDWAHLYSSQSEILDYFKACAVKYGILPHIRFNTAVVSAKWNSATHLWNIKTDKGDDINAPVLVGAIGALHIPKYPQYKGQESFVGKIVHTANWDPTLNYENKKVAVIGSGASAVQAIPEMAKTAKSITVFQRTPHWVLHRFNPKLHPIIRALFRWLPGAHTSLRWFVFWFAEFVWIEIYKRNSSRMKKVHARLLDKVFKDDVKMKAALTPNYPLGCKRLLFHESYYPALAKPNVKLVTDPIDQFYENGIETKDGTKHETEILVCATGFAPMSGYDFVIGKHGSSLESDWKGEPKAYYGMVHPNFPNWFMLYGPSSNVAVGSIVFMAECQVDYIMQAIEYLIKNKEKVDAIDLKEETQEDYYRVLRENVKGLNWNQCQSWYQNKDGIVTANWYAITTLFWWNLRHFKPELYHRLQCTS